MKKIELIELTKRDCCAVCENYNDHTKRCKVNCLEFNTINDGKAFGYCIDCPCYGKENCCPEINDSANTICKGDNFKRRTK